MKPTIVVLDDDPTGTQTVHDTPVLLRWDTASIAALLAAPGVPVFYILTNSRALLAPDAVALATGLGKAIREASQESSTQALVVSRSDSTLRGHYPAEVDALAAALGTPDIPQLLVPAFLEGGRYTVAGTHYLLTPDDHLTPVSETEFASDPTFPFSTAYLPGYVEEKTAGRVKADTVIPVPAGASTLPDLPPGRVAYANISEPCHLSLLAEAILAAHAAGNPVLLRSAASIVPHLAGQQPAPPWTPPRLDTPGLTVVGSYVRKSSEQLTELLRGLPGIAHVELDPRDAIAPTARERCIAGAAAAITAALKSGRQTVFSTYRELVSNDDPDASREIGRQVASAVSEIVARTFTNATPSYLVAKGGATASDLATNALTASRATVLGQPVAGVSAWALDTHPDLPFIVFPGNVAPPTSLLTLVQSFTSQEPGTTD